MMICKPKPQANERAPPAGCRMQDDGYGKWKLKLRMSRLDVRAAKDGEKCRMNTLFFRHVCHACEGFGWFGIDPVDPSPVMPGPARVMYYQHRWSLGLSIWNENDTTDMEGSSNAYFKPKDRPRDSDWE